VDEMEDLQINLSKKYKLYIYFIKIAWKALREIAVLPFLEKKKDNFCFSLHRLKFMSQIYFLHCNFSLFEGKFCYSDALNNFCPPENIYLWFELNFVLTIC
jgi:hypothetical protein